MYIRFPVYIHNRELDEIDGYFCWEFLIVSLKFETNISDIVLSRVASQRQKKVQKISSVLYANFHR